MNTNDWLQDLGLNIYVFLTDSALWIHAFTVLVKIVVIYILTKIVISIARKFIERRLKEREGRTFHMTAERSQTVSHLLNSVVNNVVIFVAILLVFAELGFSLAPIIAGAGVIGLAIGFGAQNIVRDVITGFFIIFEDQFSAGDFITTGKYSGTVLEIGLRVTKIKEWTGQVHILPNGAITEVTNFSKEKSTAVVDIGISYAANIAHVEQILNELLTEVYEQDEDIIEQPFVMGIQELGDSDVVIRVAAPCQTMTQWEIARKLRRVIKDTFDEKGIEIPFPQLVTYRREET